MKEKVVCKCFLFGKGFAWFSFAFLFNFIGFDVILFSRRRSRHRMTNERGKWWRMQEWKWMFGMLIVNLKSATKSGKTKAAEAAEKAWQKCLNTNQSKQVWGIWWTVSGRKDEARAQRREDARKRMLITNRYESAVRPMWLCETEVPAVSAGNDENAKKGRSRQILSKRIRSGSGNEWIGKWRRKARRAKGKGRERPDQMKGKHRVQI